MSFILYIKEVKEMKVAIVGAGKLGIKVASTLLGGDHDITVIDERETILNKISQQMM